MLQSDSFESFRVFTLDLLTRIGEALRVIDDVALQRIPVAALDPIIEELLWSFQKDPVANELVPDEIRAITTLLSSQKKDLLRLRPSLLFLQRLLGQRYKGGLEQRILSLVAESGRRQEYRSTIAAYGSFLVNCGYSKQHLLALTAKTFFEREVQRAGTKTIRGFFNALDCAERPYRVCAAVSGTFHRYLSKLPAPVATDTRDLPNHADAAFKSRHDYDPHWLYVMQTVSATDPHSAGRKLDAYLFSVQAMTLLGRRGVRFTWQKDMYAYKPAALSGDFVEDSVPALQRDVLPTGNAIQALYSQSKQILSQFDAPSTERLISSINTCALARASSTRENKLISLWSAVEVLLSDPPVGVPRILHYVDRLTPAICLKYVRRYIIAVHDELQVGYRRRFTHIVSRLPVDPAIDPYTRFTHLIFDEAHQALRTELFTMCSKNPLALHRIWKLHRDFGSPEALVKSVASHKKRVQWQLHRIYRARNQLVHRGDVPNFLDSLVVNAFEYYRSALVTILGHASRESAKSSIDQVVAEIELAFDVYTVRAQAAGGPRFQVAEFDTVYR